METDTKNLPIRQTRRKRHRYLRSFGSVTNSNEMVAVAGDNPVLYFYYSSVISRMHTKYIYNSLVICPYLVKSQVLLRWLSCIFRNDTPYKYLGKCFIHAPRFRSNANDSFFFFYPRFFFIPFYGQTSRSVDSSL